MNKLRKFFEWFYTSVVSKLKIDDALHAYASTIIFILSYGILGNFMNVYKNILWSVIITFVVGLVKEFVIDMWIRKGNAEWRDLVADVAGIVVGILLMLYLYLL